MFLYDSNQVLVAFSENSGVEESLVAPADGLYYIEVRVWEGESGYVLRVQPAGATAPTLRKRSRAGRVAPPRWS